MYFLNDSKKLPSESASKILGFLELKNSYQVPNAVY